MHLMTFGALAVAVVAVVACADGAPEDEGPHPEALAGRWVRLRPDGRWGDTMEFRPDGEVRGSVGYAVPAGLRWEVRRDSVAGAQYCSAVAGMGFCRPYRLANGELQLLGGPNGDTRFRRVP